MEPGKPIAESPPPGSIAEVVAHLALWGSLAPRGLARVVYHSEFARQRAVRALQAALEESNTPFHALDLPLFRPAAEVVRFLLDRLKGLEPGVVSISGFATAFPDDVPLPESLYLLSLNRENLARFPLRQVWWLTPHLADTFIKAVPDLHSWFIVRLRLTEAVPPPRQGRLRSERPDRPALNIDEARRRAASLFARAERAVAAGQPLADVRRDLALPAVKALFDAGAEEEARAMLTSLALLLGESEEQLGYRLGVRQAHSQKFKLFNPAQKLNNLAVNFYQHGRYREAESTLRHALEVYERGFGRGHPETATGLNNLAEVLRAQGRYAEAEPLHRRALEVRERALGPDHPDTATSLKNLAALYDAQGRYAEAEPLYRRALEVRERALGPDHPDTAASLNNLAVLYHAQGRYAEAEPLYRRALAIDEKALGPVHPYLATDLENLAKLLTATDRKDQADALRKRAGEIRERHARENRAQSR